MATLNIKRLIECRKKIGITKMEAAKRMQLSQPAYLRYESGERTPSIQTLNVIASVLHTSIEYLTNQTDDPSQVSYTIYKSSDPELFELIKKCKNQEQDMIKRILAYANNLELKP